jgi:hypothetical protein
MTTLMLSVMAAWKQIPSAGEAAALLIWLQQSPLQKRKQQQYQNHLQQMRFLKSWRQLHLLLLLSRLLLLLPAVPSVLKARP